MNPITSAQQQRVRELFEAALDLPSHERGAWAARLSADDTAVRDEVLSLLDHDQRAGNFLTDSALARVPDLLAEDGALSAGTTIGAYTIVRELRRRGEGGGCFSTPGRPRPPGPGHGLGPRLRPR